MKRNLKDSILTYDGEIEKSANLGSGIAKGLYGLGLGAVVGSEVIAPMVKRIGTARDHRDVLNRIKQIYPERKHALVEEVYGVMQHTAPHMARNFLIAKTVVDQQISTMEAMSGAATMGAQISIPTVEQIAGVEQRSRAMPTQTPSLSKIVSGAVTTDLKVASDPEEASKEEEYINFLKDLIK